MRHDEAALLVSAYALDALDDAERGPFEVHLTGCATCRDELADVRRVTDGLGEVTAVAPPPELRARVLAAATRSAQVTSIASHRRAAPPESVAAPVAAPHTGPSWLSLAAAVVAAVGLGGYALSLRSELGVATRTIGEYATRLDGVRDQLASERLNSARLVNSLSVMRAPDIIKVNLAGRADAPAATGRIYISASRGMIFETEQMPVLPVGKVYQLWVIPAGPKGQPATPVSAGTFNVAANGTFSMIGALPAGVTSTQIVAVTIEDGPDGVVQSKNQPVLLGQVSP